jgi:ribosomal protein S18 acetylase RimI-like enzyme
MFSDEVRERSGTVMEKRASRNPLEGLEIGALHASETGEALGVISRGLRDNPIHVAAFGDDPERQARRLHRLFEGAFAAMPMSRHILAARDDDGGILGVCGMFQPGDCQISPEQQPDIEPYVLENGPEAAECTMRWLGTWAQHDPEERHWHLGPVAVDAHLQGMGVGTKLMRVFSARMDAAGEDAYLETDKPENVRFYERSGFEIVGEQEVLGVPNWFMTRRAK